MAAELFRKSVVGRFNDLLNAELQRIGDDDCSPKRVAEAVLDEAVLVASPFMREMVLLRLIQQAGWLLQRTCPAKAEAVPMLIKGLVLPFRIPVADDMQDDEGTQRWIVLHKASVADLRRHKAALDHEIDGKLRYQTAISLLLATVEPLCEGDEGLIVGELLGRLSPDADAA
jgi:hypothetical protein